MRRRRRARTTRASLLALAVAVPTVVSLLTPPSALADPTAPPAAPPSSTSARERAAVHHRTVSAAVRLLREGPTAQSPDPTLALRDVFLARPALEAADRLDADGLLARPTDRARDPYGDGYSSPAVRRCRTHVCVHWVREGRDAPPSRAWAQRTLRAVEHVWRTEVDQMGYRRPASDRGRGGDSRFDVYLKDLGAVGLYGYCAPERRVPGERRTASGFCVLDDDFATAQFGAPPGRSLRVTAAHEFFHAVQFAYDFQEDPWLLESTATWMEEQLVDDADDNRSFLPYGQLERPGTPLDSFEANGFAQYGNWTFWEWLSEHVGDGLVRRVLDRAAADRGSPDEYSVQALAGALARHGGLPAVLARYASANVTPGRAYAEGRAYPTGARPARRLRPRNRVLDTTVRVDHLAATTVRVRPAAAMRDDGWRLRVVVRGPGAASSPAAVVSVRRADGHVTRRRLDLGDGGADRTVVLFGSRAVRWVGVTLVNASTRYRCHRGTSFACQGDSRDDRRPFTVRAHAVHR